MTNKHDNAKAKHGNVAYAKRFQTSPIVDYGIRSKFSTKTRRKLVQH